MLRPAGRIISLGLVGLLRAQLFTPLVDHMLIASPSFTCDGASSTVMATLLKDHNQRTYYGIHTCTNLQVVFPSNIQLGALFALVNIRPEFLTNYNAITI